MCLPEEIERRMRNSYRVKVDLTVEFVETEKILKHMSDIMQGGSDDVDQNASVQYSNGGKGKGPNEKDTAGVTGVKVDDNLSDSRESFEDDQSDFAKRRQSQRLPSIMRK